MKIFCGCFCPKQWSGGLGLISCVHLGFRALLSRDRSKYFACMGLEPATFCSWAYNPLRCLAALWFVLVKSSISTPSIVRFGMTGLPQGAGFDCLKAHLCFMYKNKCVSSISISPLCWHASTRGRDSQKFLTNMVVIMYSSKKEKWRQCCRWWLYGCLRFRTLKK